MSLTIIYKKLQELKEKEKKIQDFYDPIKVHKIQHPHIQDLRDDYQEDIQNYGFSRFAFKEEKDASIDERDRRIQSAAPSHNRMISPKGNISGFTSIKPQSAQMRPTTAKKSLNEGGVTFQNQLVSPQSIQSQGGSIRPTTANKFGFDATVHSEFQMSSPNTIQSNTVQSLFLNSIRPQTAAMKQNNAQIVRNVQSANQNIMQSQGYDTINDRFIAEDEDYNNQQEDSAQEGKKKIKHWKFTKKYDTNGKQAVRNQSALKKIVMDGQNGQVEVQDEEELQLIQERAIASRLNVQKIYISNEGEVLENRETYEENLLRRYSPTERDRLHFLDSFQSQKQFLSQGDVQFKKIYETQSTQKEQPNQQPISNRLPTSSGNENDLNQKNTLTNIPSFKGLPQNQSVKFQQNKTSSRQKLERPQTAVGFSSVGSSMKNNLTGSKPHNVGSKKRISSSRPYSASSETIKILQEDDQKMYNMKKIKSAVLNADGPHKFFVTQDYSPLEYTECGVKIPLAKVDDLMQNNIKSKRRYNRQFSKAIYIEDSSQKTQQFYIFPQLQAQLLLDESNMLQSFQSNQSTHNDREQLYGLANYISHSPQYNQSLSHPNNNQIIYDKSHDVNNIQIKRPTTAHPYQSTNINNNNNNYTNSAQQNNNYQNGNTHYNYSANQGSLQQQFIQKQLPSLNQHLLPSSSQQQLNSQQQPLLRYQSNQSLGHHLSNSSLIPNGQANPSLQKQNLPLDYTKYGSNKQRLKPKTAISKGIRSAQSYSQQGMGQEIFGQTQKRHLSYNQMLQVQEQLRNDGKKYEKNMKGFSSPMFIKGMQVKPSFGKELNSYQFNQY